MTRDFPDVQSLPHDRNGLIVGTHVVALYAVGAERYRVTVSFDPKGSTTPYFSVTRSKAAGANFEYVGGQLTFPDVDDCKRLAGVH